MKVLGWLARILGTLIALGVVIYFGARLHDGPLAMIPGGPIASGDWAEPVADWSFAKDVDTIEMQLESQSISRTTWILVKDSSAWIPCSVGFPPGKTWYTKVASDGRAVLRFGGKRYSVTLAQDDDPALVEFARGEVTRKYRNAPPSSAGVLFFRIESRARS